MIKIIPVKKTDKNAKIIMTWRNNIDTRNNSLNTNLKVWDTFKLEFYNNYFKNIPLFAISDNTKIAFVSFIKHISINNEGPDQIYRIDDTYKIGINIDPLYRGKGLSSKIIQLSICYIKKNYPNIKKIIAEIKKSNISSIKTFVKSGFVCTCENSVNIYVYRIT